MLFLDAKLPLQVRLNQQGFSSSETLSETLTLSNDHYMKIKWSGTPSASQFVKKGFNSVKSCSCKEGPLLQGRKHTMVQLFSQIMPRAHLVIRSLQNAMQTITQYVSKLWSGFFSCQICSASFPLQGHNKLNEVHVTTVPFTVGNYSLHFGSINFLLKILWHYS